MKKSFMTRALATGLSLAMAFSLTAATNVTTAAAAAKPAMKASQMTVKEGKSKTFLATAKTLKTYKITKAKVKNASAKQYISVKKNAKGTGIVVTGKKGADTARKIVITFKNKKTKKTTNLTTKVVVKAVEQPEEALTMTASVKGVKTVELEFNKTIASPDAVKVTVKKGTAARDCKATVDGTKITLAMDAKLTAGTYDVSVEGVDTTAMTANFNVEKDETLTSYEVADNIVAHTAGAATEASIKYAALNQYGEKMVASNPQVSCSFGKVVANYGSTSVTNKAASVATATKEGEIIVSDINTVLSIVGTKGTVVLVDPTLGVTTTKEVTFSAPATASELEVVGTYHKNSATLKNITENEKIGEYEILFVIKDQYGYAMDATHVGDLNATLAGGLTKLDLATDSNNKVTWTDRTVDGKDYVALSLKGYNKATNATAGDATLTIVNPNKGLLTTTTITVAKDVVIKSVNFTFENGVYTDADNELGYEIVDADGKAVTEYATITNALTNTTVPNATLRVERTKDGKAKFILKPTVTVPAQTGTDRASTIGTFTTYWNQNTSSDYLVKTVSYTVSQKKYAKTVSGIKADTVTSFPLDKTKSYKIESNKILLADQYSNTINSDSDLFNGKTADSTINTSGTAIYVASNGCIQYKVTGDGIIVTPEAVGTATVYMSYCSANAADPREAAEGKSSATASASHYDAKFTISVYDTGSVDVSTLKIKSINDGFVVASADAINNVTMASKVDVSALVGGKETIIPKSQWSIVKNENNSFNGEDTAKGVDTKTAKLTIQVTTWDNANTPIETTISADYTVSTKKAYLYKVTGTARATSTGSINKANTVDQSAFVNEFTFKTQYNTAPTGTAGTDYTTGDVKYTIDFVELLDANASKDGYKITSNGTNNAKVSFTQAGKYKFKVTATSPNGDSKSITWEVTVNN